MGNGNSRKVNILPREGEQVHKCKARRKEKETTAELSAVEINNESATSGAIN